MLSIMYIYKVIKNRVVGKWEVYKHNFHRLLNKIDERDEVIPELSNICEELIRCCDLHNI